MSGVCVIVDVVVVLFQPAKWKLINMGVIFSGMKFPIILCGNLEG